jgi:predicted ATPase with chaperone activity
VFLALDGRLLDRAIDDDVVLALAAWQVVRVSWTVADLCGHSTLEPADVAVAVDLMAGALRTRIA